MPPLRRLTAPIALGVVCCMRATCQHTHPGVGRARPSAHRACTAIVPSILARFFLHLEQTAEALCELFPRVLHKFSLRVVVYRVVVCAITPSSTQKKHTFIDARIILGATGMSWRLAKFDNEASKEYRYVNFPLQRVNKAVASLCRAVLAKCRWR
jgi:hypothetical protein